MAFLIEEKYEEKIDYSEISKYFSNGVITTSCVWPPSYEKTESKSSDCCKGAKALTDEELQNLDL